MANVIEVYVGFNCYLPDSLKTDTRSKRGRGVSIIEKGSKPYPNAFI